MPPLNDDWANATAISGASGSTSGNNTGATSETGEPSQYAGSGTVSVWWAWTAPNNDRVVFETYGSRFGSETLDTVLDVFTGSTLAGLTLVVGNDDDDEQTSDPPNTTTFGTASRVVFTPTSGTTYYLRVNGYDNSQVGSIALNWHSQEPAPTVTSISPTSASAGTSVTITGTNFDDTVAVHFRTDAGASPPNWVPATFSVDSDTQITATVPAGASSGPLKVTNFTGDGVGAFLTVPGTIGVSSITPGYAAIGDTLTIAGVGFSSLTDLYAVDITASSFWNEAGNYTVVSDTQITMVLSGTPSPGDVIAVETRDGSTSYDSWPTFTVLGAPSISSFTPSHDVIGASVVITGLSFTGTTSVEFNGQPSSFTVDSDTQITATVPAGASTGPIVVTSPAGTDTSATDFTVDLPAPGTLGVGELVFVGGHHAVSRTTTVTLTTPVDIDDGDLIVVALLLDDPTASGGITTGTFSDLEGFTPHVGYGWIMWLGYQFWSTGDPTSYSFTTTDPAIGVLACFRGVDQTVIPDGAIRAQSGTGMQTVTFSETGDLGDTRRTALYIAAGVLYGQSTGLVPRSPLVSPSVLHVGDAAGSNFALSGKELRVGYQLTQPAGTVGPYYFDGYTGVTSDEAEALCGLFVTTARGGWTVGSISI